MKCLEGTDVSGGPAGMMLCTLAGSAEKQIHSRQKDLVLPCLGSAWGEDLGHLSTGLQAVMKTVTVLRKNGCWELAYSQFCLFS